MSRIFHNNIVILHGWCPPQRCLVYEFMENLSLADVLKDEAKRRKLSFEQRMNIILDVAEGVRGAWVWFACVGVGARWGAPGGLGLVLRWDGFVCCLLGWLLCWGSYLRLFVAKG